MINVQAELRPKPLQPAPFGISGSTITSHCEVNGPSNALVIRTLDGGDLSEIERHLLDLNLADRATRFMGGRSNEAISAYARRLDASAAIMIGAFSSTGRLLGFAEAHPIPVEDAVEIAVTVADEHRRKGLGKELVARLTELAFAEGARRAEFNFCLSNRAIMRLIASLGGQFGPSSGQASIHPALALKH